MATRTTDVVLSAARYGKDKVRVFRVKRESDGVHYIVEYNVALLVEGDIETSYTEADNSVVVATDSMKNITYYLAKVSDHVLVPEHFALHLGTHVLAKYAHLKRALVTVEQLRWSRITVSGEERPHKHAFHRDGDDKRVVEVAVEKTDGKTLTGHVTAGIADLLVLKTTGSAFQGFLRDAYTTLVEVSERVLSTSVDLAYRFAPVTIPVPTDPKLLDFPENAGDGAGTVWDALGVAERARRTTLDLFATDESASVQATLYKMGERVILENVGVVEARYTLPNKHYVPVDMGYLGVDNLTPARAEVFVPVAAPSGLISATISRKQVSPDGVTRSLS